MKNISFYILLFTLVFSFASCDKEKDWVEVAREGAKPGVGFGETFIDGQPVYAAPDAGEITYPVQVFYSGSTSGANVTLSEDPALVDAFNDANGTAIPKVPAGYYTLPTSLTIPSGSSVGSADAKFNITGLYQDIGEFVYAVGLKLSGADVVSGHDEVVLIVTIQNQYEADYAVKGYFVHPSSPRPIVEQKHLSTISAIRCLAPHSDLYSSDYYFQFDVDASNKLVNYSAEGATPPEPSSGFMTQDNPCQCVTTYPGPPYTSDVYNNTYDPDNKVFWMHYGYGVGSSGQDGYSRQVYEKWTRQ